MTTFARLLIACAALTAVAALTGCGGGPDDATASGPLEGRELGRASQLEGTWLGVSEGDFVGFEFMDDGKVLATPFTAALTGMSGGVMYSYSVLDGGRLSLTTPNGQSRVFGVTIADEQMELSGFMMASSTNSQRFRRLPRGQTLEQGIEEQARLDAEAYTKRYHALREYLPRDDLVMLPTQPDANAPAAIALELVAGGKGRGWYDDSPPHIDEITAVIEEAPGGGSRPALRVSFGPQLEPASARARGGSQIIFESSGDADAPRLVANVNYGGRAFELEIKRDAGLHREIVGRFEAEKARIESLRAPFLAALKDYTVIEGRSGAQVATQATEDRLVLVKDPATGTFTGEGTLSYSGRPPQMGALTADVLVFDDTATLVVEGQYRQYQLTLADAATGKLAGAWFPKGQQNGWQTTLSITEAIDAAERDRRDAAQREALARLSPATPYVGRASILAEAWGVPQPVGVLTLTPSGSGGFDVVARYPSIDMTVNMKGAIVDALTGPRLELRPGSYAFGTSPTESRPPANVIQRQLQGQVWTLQLTEPGAADSRLAGVGTGIGPVSLEPMTEAWKRRQTETMRRILTSGAHFNAWSTTQRQAPPTGFDFKLDVGGALTGVVPERSAAMGIWPGQTFAGALGERDGLVRAELDYSLNNRPDYKMVWYAYVQPNDDVVLFGNFAQISTSRAMGAGFEMTLGR